MNKWRYCPKCGYGLQKSEKQKMGVKIYKCLNCGLRIPTPIELEVRDESQNTQRI